MGAVQADTTNMTKGLAEKKKLFRQFSHPPGAAFSCRKTPKNSAHTLLPTRKREENASIVSPKGHRKRGEKKAQFWGVFWVEKETPEDGGCGRPTRTFAPAVKSTLFVGHSLLYNL